MRGMLRVRFSFGEGWMWMRGKRVGKGEVGEEGEVGCCAVYRASSFGYEVMIFGSCGYAFSLAFL